MSDERQEWRQIAPGVYVDRNEGMHIFPGEVLTAAGWADNPGNRAQLELAFIDRFGSAVLFVVDGGQA